ncbi:unnamed protein product [Bursaphelenchus xylophilus]|uniref:(pine wood nematode) hypothetical protein n=1 Tax=Bursaphelenchus xylophilus TaxID=6326 RepID=A0A1I7RV96_BURXY|nr:unnamed protein product [Bursaphelenchus xylophilus]CAG9086572.1 unnamed protein product [Bursaphelenchus xylophilus]
MLLRHRLTLLTLIRSKSIFALSSGPSPAAVSIIRISGPESKLVLQKISRSQKFDHRLMKYCEFYRQSGTLIDKGLAVYFKGPQSFTGEDSAEFFVHGSRAVVDMLLEELGRYPNLRAAGPGEFTKRAFFNGKLDLTQAEALNDLILAETPAQLFLANRQSNISKKLQPIREALLNFGAELEANIDFGDDIQNQQGQCWKKRIKNEVKSLITVVESMVGTAKKGILVRDGVKIALIGRTNVGKSSLMNKLAERDVAIVSDIPGTTRDCLELKIRMADLNVTLFDTAGIRETKDKLELEGIKRTRKSAEEAHLLVLVVAPANVSPLNSVINEIKWLIESFPSTPKVILINKVDLLDSKVVDQIKNALPHLKMAFVSCLTNSGISSLISNLELNVKDLTTIEENEMVLSRERHLRLLEQAYESLENFVQNIDVDTAIAAEDLRECAEVIGEITGVISRESVLDKLFSSFCIGK